MRKNNIDKQDARGRKQSAWARICRFVFGAPDAKRSKLEIAVRIVLSAFFFGMTLWIFFPVIKHMGHSGMLWGVLSGVLFVLSACPGIYALVFRKNKVVGRLLWIALVCFVSLSVGTMGFLVYGGTRQPQAGGTLVVLGCQVRGETPSLMLARRMQVALEYAKQNPDSAIIATGGKGKGENISEAECIRRYLIANGIDRNRIYMEERSVNTEQNLQYSAELIRSEGLDPNIVIATSRFHQYRAALFAKKYNLSSTPLACGTESWMAPGYWGREIFAVWRAWVLGY